MIKRRNWIILLIVAVMSVAITVALLMENIIDCSKITDKKDDFHYNAITTSATIGGFLFTGLGILISTLGNSRIKRLWEHSYLDNLYRSAFLGMIANVITIVSALCMLSCNIKDQWHIAFLWIEIVSMSLGLVFFLWCIAFLMKIIRKLKQRNKGNESSVE